MSEADEVKAKVRAVLALMREEWRWAAMDERGEWWAYSDEPVQCSTYWNANGMSLLSDFDLAPFPGDWRDSLVER